MKKIKVAVLTINEDYQSLIESVLKQEGFEVDIFTNAQKCISNNKYVDYLLFIVDTHLDGYNGY